jgi:hypothetical protein
MADYEVGYGKPPKANQFKKGQSGNPAGAGSRRRVEPSPETFAAILERIGNERHKIGNKYYSLVEVEIMALQRKAAKGDVAASRLLANMRREAGLMVAQKKGGGGGVLLLPSPVPLDEWEAATARQQAKYRGEDPEGLAALNGTSFGAEED